MRDFAQAAEELGYAHMICYDHVLGASAAAYDKERLTGPYREHDMFHEPMVLFGYLAALTKRIVFTTGVIILPQRQTALVAKQAAEIDVLSGGRLRLGIGTGWNWVEYEALGIPFKDRGARQEEQVRLMRELWGKPLVNFEGRFHTVPDAGINPLPRRQIPIWFGGMAEAVLKRTAALGDGWLPMNSRLGPGQLAEMVGRLRNYAKSAGRKPEAVSIDARVGHDNAGPDAWVRSAEQLVADGATHISFNSMNVGLKGPAAHIEAIRRFKEAVA